MHHSIRLMEKRVRIPAFVLAAILEIAGCYLMWLGQKQTNLIFWLGGIAALSGFGLVLAQVSDDLPARAYAAYGGIYIAMALVWMVVMDKVAPDKWDIVGAAISVVGTLIILFGPRG
jgi:small multidrug resistance family-3 protein